MSLAGFKKQINKANQYVSEKIGGAKATEFDEDYNSMELKVDVLSKLIDELISRTHELLQPNPASRAKLSAVNSISRFRGQMKSALYPQPEGQLGECMGRYGQELGDDSEFGKVLKDCGECYKEMSEIKYSLEDNVKQNFLEPLLHMQNKDLKEVNYLRKKLSGRRLDYDCKKRKFDNQKGAVPDTGELEEARIKFEDTKTLCETAMVNLLDNDLEHINQLSSFLTAECEYHQQTANVLSGMSDQVNRRLQELASRPKIETRNNKINKNDEPCCKALYDFEPENEGELAFSEGDIIKLVSRIDENWFEGSISNRNGFFPVNYVKVIRDVK